MRSYLHYVNREVQERRQSSDSNMSFCLNESIWIGLKVAESEVAFWFFFFVPATLFDQVNREKYTNALFMSPTNFTFQ